jgi:hypothetical protein
MATYHTKKSKSKSKIYTKLGFTETQIDIAAEATTRYLKEWTNKELQHLVINKNIPVCVPIGTHGFLVGRFKVSQINNNCWQVTDLNGDNKKLFCRKLSAIYFALAEHLKSYNLSYRLYKADSVVNKLETDQDFYRNTMKVNSEKQNYFKADLAKIRYLNAKIMLKFAVDELEKTINIAKYLKVQERLL